MLKDLLEIAKITCPAITSDCVVRAMSYNYDHRKLKKREFRSLWIMRIGAAREDWDIVSSQLIYGLKKGRCELDRKILADMAIRDPNSFAAIVSFAKEALA